MTAHSFTLDSSAACRRRLAVSGHPARPDARLCPFGRHGLLSPVRLFCREQRHDHDERPGCKREVYEDQQCERSHDGRWERACISTRAHLNLHSGRGLVDLPIIPGQHAKVCCVRDNTASAQTPQAHKAGYVALSAPAGRREGAGR